MGGKRKGNMRLLPDGAGRLTSAKNRGYPLTRGENL